MRDEVFPGAQRVAEIRLKSPEEARPQLPIGGETHPVAPVTVVVTHRRDHADRAWGARMPIVPRGPVPERALIRLQVRDRQCRTEFEFVLIACNKRLRIRLK